MRRFITLGTIALIVAAMVTQWQRVRELGRQVLSRGREQISVSGEENKAIVRRLLEETMARGNLDVIDELVAPDFVDRSLMPGQGPTREDFKRSVAEIHELYSITSFTIEEQIAEGDTVVTKYTESGIQRSEVMGIPPTGEEESYEGIYIHRISGGKITEEWDTTDAFSGIGEARAVDT